MCNMAMVEFPFPELPFLSLHSSTIVVVEEKENEAGEGIYEERERERESITGRESESEKMDSKRCCLFSSQESIPDFGPSTRTPSARCS